MSNENVLCVTIGQGWDQRLRHALRNMKDVTIEAVDRGAPSTVSVYVRTSMDVSALENATRSALCCAWLDVEVADDFDDDRPAFVY